MKKKCTKCGIKKEVNPINFYKNATKKGGFQSQCKSCSAERASIKSGYQWEKNYIG